MQIETLGIDLGKSTFHVAGSDAAGRLVLQRKFTRLQLLRFTRQLTPCRVGMEACGGAHQLARELVGQGHDARLLPAQYVRPYVKTHKNDHRDAEAIAEAVQRPQMRFVPIKSLEQQDVQVLHRHRQRLVRRRTSLMNQLRGIIYERGHTAAKGKIALRRLMAEVLGDAAPSELTPMLRTVVEDLNDEWHWLDARIEKIDNQLLTICRSSEAARRISCIPGIGPITATAIVAAIADGSSFRRGRDFAAWLGLVPRQHSTGGRQRLLGISKRGNSYLRYLLVHCARSVHRVLDRQQTALGRWVGRLEVRAHCNVMLVALAAKLARIAWSVLRHQSDFDTQLAAA
jgi:transposase